MNNGKLQSPGIKDKVVVITGASYESIRPPRRAG